MRLKRHGSVEEYGGGSHGIDLAPMLDFVLNLLIFFIITAVFVKEFGLQVNRPGGQVQQSGAAGEGSVSIRILSSGEIFVDDRLVDIRAVSANVERVHAVSPSKAVLIFAEEEAPTGVLIQVVDQVHIGGVYDITFATGR
jgi:biopolymer transport protein ExbD